MVVPRISSIMSAAFYGIKMLFSRYQVQCSFSVTTLHVLRALFISEVQKPRNVSEIQTIFTSGVKLSSCLTSHRTAQFRTAVANAGKHTQMLTPCHFRITSCLDIHAQKTELFHAFKNHLSPLNSSIRGNHWFFPRIKDIYMALVVSLKAPGLKACFPGLSTVVMPA